MKRCAVDAARMGDVERLAQWLVEGRDPDARDLEGWTPLLAAAARGKSETVELLLFHDILGARRASPDIRFTPADALPIYMAGQSGELATVKALLRARPDHVFDVATINGHTLLLQAAFYGQKPHQELARYLLEEIDDVLCLQPRDDAAVAAARKRLLVATNVRGQNPLAVAKAYSIKPMIALLTEFDLPTERERSNYYQQLLQRIAPPVPRDEDERRAQALTDRLIEVIESGLDRAQLAPGNPPATGGVTAEDENTLAAVDELLGSPGLQTNRLGGPLQRTPIIIACTGADANARMRALRGTIVDRLLAHGADPLVHEVHAMGIGAVIRAAVWGHLYLLERFATVMSPDAFAEALNEKPPVNGFTALHDSVLRGLSASDELLAEYLAQITWARRHGARYDIEDHAGRTPVAIARAALDDPEFRENARLILESLLAESVVDQSASTVPDAADTSHQG